MKLVGARVSRFWNFVDSHWIEVEPDVTALVGKNESGKTALLQALYRLNPVEPSDAEFDPDIEYPRWRKVRDARELNLTQSIPVEAQFVLESDDLAALMDNAGTVAPEGVTVTASRNYGGELTVRLNTDEGLLVRALADDCNIHDSDQDLIDGSETIHGFVSSVKERLAALSETESNTERATALRRVSRKKGNFSKLLEDDLSSALQDALISRLPKFYYFDDVSILPGRLDPERLLGVSVEKLHRSERTALSLMRMAGVAGREFTDDVFERRIAELEAAASEIKRELFTYWTQNTDLRIHLAPETERIQQDPQGDRIKRVADIRVEDTRHEMTTNITTRSQGFQWFFSFIAGFSQFEESDPAVVVLLDEPGLGLHAQAQKDFLRYIDERLGAGNQVLYTTHSPFMVDPKQLERVRVVEDQTTRAEPDIGAKVFRDQLSVDSGTVFPLQAALGYDLAQHLFVGAATHVVVEGSSDFTYLSEMSDFLSDQERTCLDERISLVPVGGIDKVPTFVALLGAHVEVTVLVDSRVAGSQKLADYSRRGLLSAERLVTIADVAQRREADIEDLFEEDEYLMLFNGAFDENLGSEDLVGDDPIVRRIERAYGAFNHGKPATQLLRRREAVAPSLSGGTLERFEGLFQKLNETISR